MRREQRGGGRGDGELERRPHVSNASTVVEQQHLVAGVVRHAASSFPKLVSFELSLQWGFRGLERVSLGRHSGGQERSYAPQRRKTSIGIVE